MARTKMAIKIDLNESAEEIVVRVEGDLDLSAISTFKHAVDKAFESREGRRLVFDLREALYVDSAGLEQLLLANRRLGAVGDRLLVRVEPDSQPHTVLAITGFNAVMDVEPVAHSE